MKLVGFLLIMALAVSPAFAEPAHPGSAPAAQSADQLPTRGSMAEPIYIAPVETSKDKSRQAISDRIQAQEAQSNWLIMLFTGGMLLIAGVQAFLFLRQLKLMRESLDTAASAARSAEHSVEIMRDTAQRQLRAYISIETSKIEFPEPGRPKVTVNYRNAGQTPAYDVQTWIHQWIACYPMRCELPRPPGNFVMSKSVLGPGAHHTMIIEAPKPIAKEPYLDLVGTAEGTIYVFGEIRYKDVFGNAHLYKYKLMHGGNEPSTPGMLKPCMDGNEST